MIKIKSSKMILIILSYYRIKLMSFRRVDQRMKKKRRRKSKTIEQGSKPRVSLVRQLLFSTVIRMYKMIKMSKSLLQMKNYRY